MLLSDCWSLQKNSLNVSLDTLGPVKNGQGRRGSVGRCGIVEGCIVYCPDMAVWLVLCQLVCIAGSTPKVGADGLHTKVWNLVTFCVFQIVKEMWYSVKKTTGTKLCDHLHLVHTCKYQSWSGKYHKFVIFCIVSVQQEKQCHQRVSKALYMGIRILSYKLPITLCVKEHVSITRNALIIPWQLERPDWCNVDALQIVQFLA